MADDLPSWATKNRRKTQPRAATGSDLPSWAAKPAPKQAAKQPQPERRPSRGGGNFFQRFGSDLKNAAEHVPGGLLAVGNAARLDLQDTLTLKDRGGHSHLLDEILIPAARQTAADLRHPLRHPGNTLLDATAIVSAGAGAAARASAAGKALGETGRISEAGKALVTRPNPGVRTFSHQGVTVKVPASPNAAVRAAQKHVIDPLRHRFPDVPLVGSAATVGRRLGKEVSLDKRVADAVPAGFLKAAKKAGMLRHAKTGKKVFRYSPDALARQQALRIVAEGVPVEQRVATHKAYLERGYNPSARKNPDVAAVREKDFTEGHAEQVALNEAASKYVRTVETQDGKLVPRFTKLAHDDGLVETYHWAQKVTGSREDLLSLIDKLDPETATGRLSAPGRVFFGRGEDFAGGEIRIPTVPKGKAPRSRGETPEIGAQRVVNGIPDQIPSVYKPYLGKAYKGGRIRNDVVRLVHESWQEAQRYFTLVNVTERLKSVAKDVPTSKYDIPIKVQNLPGQAAMRSARDVAEESLSDPSKLAQLAYRYEAVRQRIFPDYDPGDNWQRAAADTAAQLGPGYKWVDRRLVGGLNRRNPLLSAYDHKSLKGTLAVADAVNNASKIAILYLKPAYVAPNLLGNIGLNLVQQGFAAPANLKRAARLNAELEDGTYQQVLHAVGEGFTGSLDSRTGKLQAVAHRGADFYGNVLGVDKYPRVAAFLYEAGKEGFKTGDELKRLFEPENRDSLHAVMERTDRAMIDYGDLSPVEQSIVRRVIFFYPWVKGATKWSVRFVTEHPVQAASGAALAKIGEQQQTDALGELLPSWAQSLVAVGRRNGLPTTVNPSSISVLSTPADVAGSLASGKASDLFSPALALAQGYRHPVGALEDQARSLPIVPVADVALHELGVDSQLARPSRTYPYERTPREALLLYLLGSGLTPRETVPQVLRRSAILEQRENR